jgi:hypothetical protein
MVAELDKLKEDINIEDPNIKVGTDGVVTSEQPPVLYESDFYTVSWEEDYYHGRETKQEDGHVIDLAAAVKVC